MIDSASFVGGFRQNRYAYIGIILLLNTIGLLYYFYYLTENGYLPSPFIYDKSDTFMDLFNTMYWAYEDGRYTDWGSVYPPLGFLFLKVLNFVFDGSHYGDPAHMRENSAFVIFGFGLLYLLVPALVLKTKLWQGFVRNEKICIYFLIVFSTPMLFTLERGNLIILAPIFLALALSKIGFLRVLSIAMLINIKPYFVILMMYYVARRNWKGLVVCTITSGLIFAISGLALDSHFLVLLANILDFSQEDGLFSIREVLALPSSISAFSYVLKHPDGAMLVSAYLNPERINDIAYIVEATKWAVLVCSFAIFFVRSRLMRDAEVLALLIVVISNLGVWVGGYTYIFYIALIPVFMKMRARWLYIGLLSPMALPLDMMPLSSDFIGMQYSYFADAYINIEWTLGMGSVIRPATNLILLMSLACEFFLRSHKGTRDDIVRHAERCVDNLELMEKRLHYV